MLVTVNGGAQLQALGAKLSAAGSEGKQLRTRVRRNIVAAVEPMKTAVQQAILEIPAESGTHSGLRERMAKATVVRVRASGRSALVRLEVAGSRMPAGEENLPAYMDGEKKPWKHPVWDSARERWVKTPQAAHPFFARTVRPMLPGVRIAVNAAVRETAAMF